MVVWRVRMRGEWWGLAEILRPREVSRELTEKEVEGERERERERNTSAAKDER